MPNPSNLIAVEDIKQVQDIIARENKMLVYGHFNMIVCCPADTDMQNLLTSLKMPLTR